MNQEGGDKVLHIYFYYDLTFKVKQQRVLYKLTREQGLISILEIRAQILALAKHKIFKIVQRWPMIINAWTNLAEHEDCCKTKRWGDDGKRM